MHRKERVGRLGRRGLAVAVSFLGAVVFFGGVAQGRRPRRGRARDAYEKRIHQMQEELLERQKEERIKSSLKMVEELKRLGLRANKRPPRWQQKKKKHLGQLRSPDPSKRAEAAWWLGINGAKSAVPKLVRLLKDKNELVRSHAVFALGRLGAKHMGSRLYDMLERDESVKVRGRVAEALGRLGYTRAIPLLNKALSSRDVRLKMGALEGLGRMNNPQTQRTVLRYTRDEDPAVRLKVAEALGRMGLRRGAPVAVRMLGDEDPSVVAAAVRSIEALGHRGAIPNLVALLSRDDEGIVLATVKALEGLEAVEKWKALRDLWLRSKGVVAASAALAVARLGGELSLGGLQELLGSDDNRARLRGVRAAGIGGARWAVKLIEPLLKHPHAPLRREAALALGRLESFDSAPKLLKLLKDPVDEVRVAAVVALGRLGGPRTLPACAILIGDGNPSVAAAAVRCISFVADSDWELAVNTGEGLASLLRLRADPVVAAAVARALGAIGVEKNRKGYLRLIRLTLHRSARCRVQAALALGKLPKKTWRESLTPLKRLLERDRSMPVRLAAAFSLALMGREEVFSQVLSLFRAQVGPGSLSRRFRAALALGLLKRQWRLEAKKLFLSFVGKRPNTFGKREAVSLMEGVQRPWLEKLLELGKRSPNALVRAEARRVLGEKPPPPKTLPKPPKPKPSTPRREVQDAGTAKKKKNKKKKEEYGGPFPVEEKKGGEEGGCLGCGCKMVGGRPESSASPWGLVGLLFLIWVLWDKRRV